MMQKVQCADGSRVKNIKEHFEVLSYEAAASETEVKFKCSLNQRLEKTSGRQICANHLSSSIQKDETKDVKSSYPAKENALKNDKCSIKRTPAFRCDKIVKGKIVTGQSKEKHKYVENKVKLFEDGGMRMLEPSTERSQVVPEVVIHKKSGEPNVHRTVVSNSGKNPDIPKRSYPKREIVSPASRNIPSEEKMSNLNELQTKVGFHSAVKPTREDLSPKKLSNARNGDIVRDDTHVTPRSIASSEDNLKDILRSPLPRGPPPRKPPRTFAHCTRSATQLNTVQKYSRSPKEVTKELLRTSAEPVFPLPALVRSKTESQIELRNKLETVLAKLQAGDNLPQSPPTDQNKKNSQPLRTRPANKPDLSPSSLLVGCLSLGCVNSHQYEEVGAGRPFNAASSDRRESMDIRLLDTAAKENTSGSLLRSQSEDHIYAVPFVDVKDISLPKRDVSLQSQSKDVKNRTDEVSKRYKEANTTGLHYMCTPILTTENLHTFNTHEELPHAGGVLGPLRCGALEQKSPFLNIPNAKEFGNSSKINGKMNHINENAGKTFHEDGKEAVQPSKAGEDGLNAESKSSLCGSSTDNEEELGEEEHDPVTKEIVEQRKGYVRRMCSIFNKIQQQAQENSSPLKSPMAAVGFLGKNSPNPNSPSPVKQSLLQPPDPMCENDASQHLFECVLLVGLTLSSGADKGSRYMPYIKSKFPANVLVPPLIEHLCFPDASDWTIRRSLSPKAEGSKKRDSKSDDEMKVDGCDQTYSLVITGADGSRRFGYCRRVLPEGGSMCLPLTYCLISPYRANGFYFKVLAELESRHGGPESEQNAFLQELYSCHLPGPSEVLQLPSSAEPLSPFVQPLRRPFDVRLEEKEVMELVTCLEVGVFLDVFASILLERKVLLTSKYLSKLSCCVQALQSVLYPFTWQHTFIPVLPAPMFDICGAPTPYIIGILKGSNGQIPSISFDEGIMVDLDTSNCIKKVGDEGSILPSRMKRMLQSALRIISSMKNSHQNSNKKNANSGDDIDVCNVLVSDAFMGTFLFVVGHYPNHVVNHGDGHRTFQREKFIEAMPFAGVRMFLEWFTETAMFTSFINASLEGSGDSEFERRAKQFCEETWKDSLLFLKAYKNFMKKSKSLGDRKKDRAIFT